MMRLFTRLRNGTSKERTEMKDKVKTRVKAQTWTFQDRSHWSKGPWDYEPDDKIVWSPPYTGLVCMLHRSHTGAWCGYVGVEPTHPLYGTKCTHWASEAYLSLDVHGGVTFSDGCHGMNEDGSGICHPTDGNDHAWWIGFDTNHTDDKTPTSGSWTTGETYRTEEYAMTEALNLAKQLHEWDPQGDD